ncbi:MAG: TlpA family protein disulfide reductase [Myxococcales bacterium]|nr:TlpA family protein disulfide reductase [Myxococcales bacterium]
MRPTAMRALLVTFLLMLATAGAAQADVLKVGDRLTELDVATDGNGKPIKLKSFRGKWVVITVGADWCKPCAKELPTWDKIAGELKGKVVFVAVDIDDEIAVGKKFHDKLKIKHMVRAYMPSDKSGVAGNYGSDHMPSTFVADDKGIVRLVREGFEAGDADGEYRKFKDALTKLLPRS